MVPQHVDLASVKEWAKATFRKERITEIVVCTSTVTVLGTVLFALYRPRRTARLSGSKGSIAQNPCEPVHRLLPFGAILREYEAPGREEGDVEMLTLAANQIGVAMDNAGLGVGADDGQPDRERSRRGSEGVLNSRRGCRGGSFSGFSEATRPVPSSPCPARSQVPMRSKISKGSLKYSRAPSVFPCRLWSRP